MSQSCWCALAGHQMSLYVEHMVVVCFVGAMCTPVYCLSPPIQEPTESAPMPTPLWEPTESTQEPAPLKWWLSAPPWWHPALPALPWHPCLPIPPGPLPLHESGPPHNSPLQEGVSRAVTVLSSLVPATAAGALLPPQKIQLTGIRSPPGLNTRTG